MLLRRAVHSIALLGLVLVTTSANQHLQTSADPVSQELLLELGGEKVSVLLDGEGVEFEKSPKGHLTYLSFFRLNRLVKLWFHPHSDMDFKEKVSLSKRFQLADGRWLLHGPQRAYDRFGELLWEANWMEGRLHGAQRVLSEFHVLREERHFDQGYPVGEWKLFYDGGELASQTTFPDSKKAWKKTFERGSEPKASLYFMDYVNPLSGKETWYSPDGYKQKEQVLVFRSDGKTYHVEESGEVRYFDIYGNVVRTILVADGEGSDTNDFTTMGSRYRRTLEWRAGHPYKTEVTALPSHQN